MIMMMTKIMVSVSLMDARPILRAPSTHRSLFFIRSVTSILLLAITHTTVTGTYHVTLLAITHNWHPTIITRSRKHKQPTQLHATLSL